MTTEKASTIAVVVPPRAKSLPKNLKSLLRKQLCELQSYLAVLGVHEKKERNVQVDAPEP